MKLTTGNLHADNDIAELLVVIVTNLCASGRMNGLTPMNTSVWSKSTSARPMVKERHSQSMACTVVSANQSIRCDAMCGTHQIGEFISAGLR